MGMTDPAIDIERIARLPTLVRARQLLRQTDDETLADQAELVAIPAPPFGEAERARRVLERFREVGLEDAVLDDAGNVLARLPGNARDGAAPVILSAHLDTVFPEGTDVTVRRNGQKIYAPGIADDARGLAAILAIARVLVQAGVRTSAPVVFAATVGEEGAGDLRGVKHLFRERSPWRGAAGFVSLDGTGCRRIVHRIAHRGAPWASRGIFPAAPSDSCESRFLAGGIRSNASIPTSRSSFTGPKGCVNTRTSPSVKRTMPWRSALRHAR